MPWSCMPATARAPTTLAPHCRTRRLWSPVICPALLRPDESPSKPTRSASSTLWFTTRAWNTGNPDGSRRWLEHVFAINVLAPYRLTALIGRLKRLISLSSGMHRSGEPRLDDLQWTARPWNGAQAYADSKLYDVMLAFGIARRWPMC